MIDGKADQILTGINTAGLSVGAGVTQSLVGRNLIESGQTTALDGDLKGIITEIGAGQIGVKILSRVKTDNSVVPVDYQPSLVSVRPDVD